MVRNLIFWILFSSTTLSGITIWANDGYKLWLDHSRISDDYLRELYTEHFLNLVIATEGNIIDKFEDAHTCPLEYLLWFHKVSWDTKLNTGRSLWEELCHQYYEGAGMVDDLIYKWQEIKSYIDPERFEHVLMHLNIQKKEAKWWRDACLVYFQQYSEMSIPSKYEQPEYGLEHYMSISHPYAPGIRPRW